MAGITCSFVRNTLKEQFSEVAPDVGAKYTVHFFRRPVFTEFPFSLPFNPTQQTIAAFHDKETAKMDMPGAGTESAIELLKKHPSALIIYAVTGKINIYGLVVCDAYRSPMQSAPV